MKPATLSEHRIPLEASAASTLRPQRWTLFVLGVVLVAAGWLRFVDLGRLSFWADEFPHAIAARSLIHEHSALLPSGRPYRRAFLQTAAVSASMRALGENETAARVPSAVIGLGSVALIWFAARKRFGDVAALAAASAIGAMPQHVAHSRSARFYVAFALAYATAAVLSTRALETRSKRVAVGALAAFALAMHLQLEAATLLLPVICYAGYLRAKSPERHASLGRTAVYLAGGGLVALVVIALVPQLRESATWLIDNLPGLELKPGLHFDTLGKLFGVVSWWAWIPLAPAALLGLRRAGASGVALALHLIVPALALAVLFAPTADRGIGFRYLFYLLPFLGVVVGLGVAELLRAVMTRREVLIGAAAVVLAMLFVVGGPTVWRLPFAPHPGRLIPRPNWNAATSVVRERLRNDDALLSTTPLATAWRLGRCADWIRQRAAAEKFLDDRGRDIYCRSRLLPDAVSLRAYLAENPRGWVIADPGQWRSIVDPGARAYIERTATPVDAGDDTILVWRWDLASRAPRAR